MSSKTTTTLDNLNKIVLEGVKLKLGAQGLCRQSSNRTNICE